MQIWLKARESSHIKNGLIPWSLTLKPEDGNIPLAETPALLVALSYSCVHMFPGFHLFIYLFLYLRRNANSIIVEEQNR